jgi:hypothetical protein
MTHPQGEAMISVNIDSILELTQQLKLESEIQKETHQIHVNIKVADRNFPLFIRIFEGNHLLQLLVFIPCNMKASAAADLARLLHLLNKELDMPGFGMDETAKVVFYRAMIPIVDQQVSSSLLSDYLDMIQNICDNFAPVVATVATGSSTYDEVLSKIKEHQSKNG